METFASGAEAVAHFSRNGFTQPMKESDDYRCLLNPETLSIVRIYHIGFLEWKAVLSN